MSIKAFILSILIFSGLVVGYYQVSNQTGGIFEAYGFIAPSNNTLQSFDKMDELSQVAEDMGCDLNPEKESCPERRSNPLTDSIVGRMVLGGYGALLTLEKAISIPKAIFIDAGNILGVPPILVEIAITGVIITLLITIVLIVFNRSDVG